MFPLYLPWGKFAANDPMDEVHWEPLNTQIFLFPAAAIYIEPDGPGHILQGQLEYPLNTFEPTVPPRVIK